MGIDSLTKKLLESEAVESLWWRLAQAPNLEPMLLLHGSVSESRNESEVLLDFCYLCGGCCMHFIL